MPIYKKVSRLYPFTIMLCLCFILPSFLLPAQGNPDEAVSLPPSKLTPVFPEPEEGLIYIEGEDAVSTNFSTTAVYNYGASAYRSLQLIQQNILYGGQPYYGQYTFYVEEAGEYYFWYGGTPPGPKEDVYPSYASPFKYVLDDQDPVPVYREDLAVVEAYTPSYYWMEVGKVSLTKGIHNLRIEVSEKRRYDGKYFFFMDALFFLREDKMEEELVKVPPLFPQNRLDRSLDNPFQSISHYKDVIKEDPGEKNAYISLSMVYSLLGDYLNAIRNLNSAVSLDPADPYPLLLMAKNRIWNGEVSAGLTLYKQLLQIAPENVSYWTEAGKVAAWTGKYRESIEFFTEGLKLFPDDLNLKVNLGLTYLWMSRGQEAEMAFRDAEENAAGDHDKVMALGDILSVNGYPEYSVKIYEEEISQSPGFLETYLSLEEAYRNTGETDKAEKVIEQIYNTFEESDDFSSFMNVYEEKVRMKESILKGYRTALKENPDNNSLRQELAQTYFWNGLQDEAVDEYLKILVNKMYLVFKDFDRKGENLLTLGDRLSYVTMEYRGITQSYRDASKALGTALSAYEKALSAVEKKPEEEGLVQKREEQSLLLSEAYENAVFWMERLAEQESLLKGLRMAWDPLFSTEQEEEAVFQQLLGDLKWSWDRDFTRRELGLVQKDEPFLTQYILGRLSLFEDRKEEASVYLNDTVFGDDPPARYALYQSWLWQGNREKQENMWRGEADILTLYRPHLFDLEATVRQDPSRAAASSLPSKEDMAVLTSSMEARERMFREDTAQLESFAEDIREALDQKLTRQMYYFEQETLLLRYELGDYYLDMDRNLDASRQFQRVLALDPWNLSANYKLGVVSQRSGNWSRAMKQYMTVYYQVPDYENVLQYYNQLARTHADSFDFTAQNVTDPSRISYQGNVNYKNLINDRLGWEFSYQLDMDRLYRTFGNEEPSSFKLHTLGLHVPVTIPSWNLTIAPLGGVQLSNAFFGKDYESDSSDSVSIQDNYDEMTIKPLGGLNIHWVYEFLTTDLDYRYHLEEDSLFAGRNLTRNHTFELQADTYFPLENRDLFGPVTTRTFGSLELLQSEGRSDLNRINQIVQEVTAGYVLSEAPQIRLTANALVNYEDGKDKNRTDYYVPDGVLEAKGGMRGTLNLHNDAYTENVEVSLWGSGGGYWTRQEGSSPSLKLEGQFSLYYVKGNMMLYLLIGGNGTYDNGIQRDPLYWEMSSSLGCRINLPLLLVP